MLARWINALVRKMSKTELLVCIWVYMWVFRRVDIRGGGAVCTCMPIQWHGLFARGDTVNKSMWNHFPAPSQNPPEFSWCSPWTKGVTWHHFIPVSSSACPPAGARKPATLHHTRFYFPWLMATAWSQAEVPGSGNLSKPTRSRWRACSPGHWELLHNCWTDPHVYLL